VPWLARDLGANRQNVQRIVNDLHKESLVAFKVNPHHRRAPLVVLTEKGKRTFEAAMELQAPWVNSLADGLSVKDIETVHRVVTALRKKLEGNSGDLKNAPSR
jgi:DNA-binding MarR family transcriptional regulator